jgi:glycosyltransferase involved in cell wall biosynthesis
VTFPPENPLVSIVVITYNSSEYVLETLESAKAQTYQNIELIVSDDCSTDDTVETCRRWIAENKERFVRTELITIEKNSGIPANCNRGVRAARGEWVKGIAGDDLMSGHFVSKCLEGGVPDDIGIIYTNSFFIDAHGEVTGKANSSNYKSGHVFDDLFFLRFWPKAPSLMFRYSALEEFGFFDESIWVEDYLMVLKIASKYQLRHIDGFMTYYRIHGNNSGGKHIRLHQAQLSTIEKFGDYPGYRARRRAILLQMLEIQSTEQPREAMKLIRANLPFLLCPKGVSAFFQTCLALVKS